MVIIIRLKRNPNSIRIEVWEMIPNTGQVTRARQANLPACTHTWDIDENGVVTPQAPLIIPYLTIFDTPHIGGTDIVFTVDDLTRFAVRAFSQL